MEDTHPVGTVIRWISSDQYTYAAVKATPTQWYTSSAARGGVVTSSVGQILSWPGLWGVLTRTESSDVEIASAWEPIFDHDLI